MVIFAKGRSRYNSYTGKENTVQVAILGDLEVNNLDKTIEFLTNARDSNRRVSIEMKPYKKDGDNRVCVEINSFAVKEEATEATQ